MLTALFYTPVVKAQSLFSIEIISEEEYLKAAKESSPYNIIPSNSKPKQSIVSKVLKQVQEKFQKLDSLDQEIFWSDMDSDAFSHNSKQFLYVPEMKLFGFILPNFELGSSVWWFNSESGRYISYAAAPMAINSNGIYVAHIGDDCDWPFDLRFFKVESYVVYECESYKNHLVKKMDLCYHKDEDWNVPKFFWGENNTLYLKPYDKNKRGNVYIKIKI
ncbi:MAG: hypothetical protein HDT04_00200 [Bacteroidales bacterium]|nr:hypothetical protein [Bacteroidales bacterium]